MTKPANYRANTIGRDAKPGVLSYRKASLGSESDARSDGKSGQDSMDADLVTIHGSTDAIIIALTQVYYSGNHDDLLKWTGIKM